MKRSKTGTVLRLLKYMMNHAWGLLLAVGLTIGSNLLALLGPKLSGRAIDAIEPGVGLVDFATVRYFAGLMALFFVVSAVMDYLLNVLMITISRKITYRMRRDIFNRLAAAPDSDC